MAGRGKALLLLVVIHDFDLRRANLTWRPLKADPPLHVDADTELPGSVTTQTFQAIAAQDA
jgi:hypothetical protein